MTYSVLMGTLNPTHSLTHSLTDCSPVVQMMLVTSVVLKLQPTHSLNFHNCLPLE